MKKPPQGLPKDNNLSSTFGNEITTSSDTFITHRGRFITPPREAGFVKAELSQVMI